MTDLQRFTAVHVQEMAQSISRELGDFTASLDQLESSLEAFKFRDPSACYWTVGPGRLQWCRFVQGQWMPAGSPSGTLEGPEILNGWIAATRRRESPDGRTRQEPQVSSAPAFLQAMVQETRQAYERGEISSAAAESSLTGFYLLDRSGRFWTPGFRTGSWYSFEAGRWNRAQQAPSPEALLDLRQTDSQRCPHCGTELGEGSKFCRNCGNPAPLGSGEITDQVGQAVADFLSLGMDTSPETVTDPWNPPPGFPELIRQCQVCGVPDVGSHANCRACRSPFAIPTSPPPQPITRAHTPPPPPSSSPATRISPSRSGPPPQAYPTRAAPRVTPPPPRAAPATPSRPFPWVWIAGGGCALTLLCAACALLALWAEYGMGLSYRLGLR